MYDPKAQLVPNLKVKEGIVFRDRLRAEVVL